MTYTFIEPRSPRSKSCSLAAPTAKERTTGSSSNGCKGTAITAATRRKGFIRADGAHGEFVVTGPQACRTLRALISAGSNGITSLEVSVWALRLAAYCFELRHKYGLNIATIREQHETGWHGRYVLLDRVTIVDRGRE